MIVTVIYYLFLCQKVTIESMINFPDDEIRQSEGFKNVNLGNVISSSYKADKKTAFLTMEDHILLEKIGVAAFELQVLNVGLRHFR